MVISTGEPRDPAEVTFLRCKEGSVEAGGGGVGVTRLACDWKNHPHPSKKRSPTEVSEQNV